MDLSLSLKVDNLLYSWKIQQKPIMTYSSNNVQLEKVMKLPKYGKKNNNHIQPIKYPAEKKNFQSNDNLE